MTDTEQMTAAKEKQWREAIAEQAAYVDWCMRNFGVFGDRDLDSEGINDFSGRQDDAVSAD